MNQEREVSHVEPVTGADSCELYARISAVSGVQDLSPSHTARDLQSPPAQPDRASC